MSADPDSLQDTVTSELVQDERSVDLASFLVVVRDDATNEVRVGVPQGGHQLCQLFLGTARRIEVANEL